jgi:DNA polymerase-3 subunit alpha
LDKFSNANAITIKDVSEGGCIRIGGIVSAVKTIRTKRGDQMAFVTVEDMHGSAEATVFSSVYASVNDLLFEDNPILIQGRVQKDEQAVKILADSVVPIEKVEETWTASIHFNLELARTDRSMLLALQDIFKRHPGSCRAFLHLRGLNNTETIIALPDTMKLRAGSALKHEVDGFLGYQAVDTVCSPAGSASNINGPRQNNRKSYR